MNEQPDPSTPTDVIGAAERSRLDGEIGHLGKNLTFQTVQREPLSSLPSITSVWKPDLIANAQAVADRRGVPLDTIVGEWEAIWAVNG